MEVEPILFGIFLALIMIFFALEGISERLREISKSIEAGKNEGGGKK